MKKLLLCLPLLALFATAPALARGEMWHETNGGPGLVALPSMSPLVKKVEGAVLTIQVEAEVSNASNEPFFRGFGFEFKMPEGGPMKGQGTGFLIHEDGYALTNHHVIENADKIRVKVGSAPEWYDATVIGTDRKTDVALIKLEGKKRDWPYLPLGDSDRLEIGDFVVAIGNPFGLSQTVSMGIISANHRRDIMPSGRDGLYDFLQTDASINPGNSGGPLINVRGEVVGINAAVNRAGQGLGFAIPINLVKQLVPQLKDKGSVRRSWIGIGIRPVTPELAKGFGLDRPRGALVAQVVQGGPADKAGLEPGDVVTRFDGKDIEEHSDLPLLAAHAGVGREVPMEVLREGKHRNLSVRLGELPDDDSGPAHPHISGDDRGDPEAGKLGVRVQDLDEDMRRRLDLDRSASGSLVVQVSPGSVAAEAGLQRGDVIYKVNGKRVKDADGFVRAVKRTPRGQLLRLLVLRGDDTVFVALAKP